MSVMADETQVPATPRLIAEKELFSWNAPSRPFKRRDREFWVTLGAIAFIGGLILFLIEGVMPVILIISIVFLYYVMSTVAPESIAYAITNLGVKIADKRTDWDYLTRFWFSKRFDSDLLVFEMDALPGRLELVIDGKDKEKLREVLVDFVIEEEASPSGLDKAATFLVSKLPLKK
jgi:hypothetical protein